MKATEPGATVGIALENFDGSEGKVLCFLDVGERNTGVYRERIEKLEEDLRRERDEKDDLKRRVEKLEGRLSGAVW